MARDREAGTFGRILRVSGFNLPEGLSYYQHSQRLDLEILTAKLRGSRRLWFSGEPNTGTLHVLHYRLIMLAVYDANEHGVHGFYR